MFLRKAVLRKCSKFTGERPCQSDISIELLCNFIEIAFQHGCFPVNLLHFFRKSFLKNTSGRLLLKIISDESTATVNQYYTSKTFKKLILDLKETVKKYFSSKNINRLIFVQPYISWICIIQVYSILCIMETDIDVLMILETKMIS